MNPSSIEADRFRMALYIWYSRKHADISISKVGVREFHDYRFRMMEDKRIELLCGRKDDLTKFVVKYRNSGGKD